MAAYSTQDSENSRSQNNREGPEESPELLRWRADSLLDEMMLGGIDTSAASPTGSAQDIPSPASAYHAETSSPNNGSANHWEANNSSQATAPHPYPKADGYGESPYYRNNHRDQPSNHAQPAVPSAHAEQPNSTHQNGRAPQDTARHQSDGVNNQFSHTSSGRPEELNDRTSFRNATEQPWGQSPFERPESADEPSRGQPEEPMLRPPSAVGGRSQQSPYRSTSFLGPQPQHNDRHYDDRHDDNKPYQQSAGYRQPAENRPAYEYEQPAERQSYPYPPRAEAGPEQTYGQAPPQSDLNEPFAVQKEPKPWSVVSGGPGDYLTSVPRRSDAPYNAPQTRYAYDPVLGPTAYQPHSSRFADSMAVGAQAKRRTNVWPRHSRFDIQALQQEMNTLQEQIDLLVRRRLDISERAQHLLDKGRTILENDPDRSAEVTYYVQQVRTMVQRTGQRVQWSNVYRTRLFTYLTAWLALSAVGLAGCILYSDLMRLWLSQFAAFALDSFPSQHIVALFGTLASATLGSAFAALINAWRHSQKEYGYFDRKYGLLGAVLPVIGLLVGLLIYLVFGVIYWLFELNPAESLVAAWIPAILALVFGASQEKIYGTTE